MKVKSNVLASLAYVGKSVCKCSSLIGRAFVNVDPTVKFATIGYPRCGNVFLNRSLRLGRESSVLEQTFHSAGIASLLVQRRVNVCVITRDPVEAVLSNKLANPHISVSAFFIGYVLFHLRILCVKKNITVVTLPMIKDPDEHCLNLLRDFLGESECWTLPNSKKILRWIASDPPWDNNPMHLSAPSAEKIKKIHELKPLVSNHPLVGISQLCFGLVTRQTLGAKR